MSLAAHLLELRKRLFISAIAIVVAAIFGFWASPWVFEALQEPIFSVAENSGREAALNFETVAGAFDLTMQIAITIAIVIASPIWLYQIWAFLTPGLVSKERRYVIGFLGTAIPLFLLGCYIGWVAMPRIIEVMIGFAPEDSISNLGARYYYDFILKLLIAVGIAFVLPVLLVFLNFARVITGRAILKGWRFALLGILLFTAAATPTVDVMSMFLLAGPMVVLYFVSIGIAMLNDRRVARRDRILIDEALPS
jgi:sec-independent protein translocase protein TatC